jgi:hypothetical protein
MGAAKWWLWFSREWEWCRVFVSMEVATQREPTSPEAVSHHCCCVLSLVLARLLTLHHRRPLYRRGCFVSKPSLFS